MDYGREVEYPGIVCVSALDVFKPEPGLSTSEHPNVAPETPPAMFGMWRPGGVPVTQPELFEPGTLPGPPPASPRTLPGPPPNDAARCVLLAMGRSLANCLKRKPGASNILVKMLPTMRQHSITWIGRVCVGNSFISKTILFAQWKLEIAEADREDLVPATVTAKHLDFFKEEPITTFKRGVFDDGLNATAYGCILSQCPPESISTVAAHSNM